MGSHFLTADLFMYLPPHPPSGTLPRVAILIDGDNIPRTDRERVEDEGARMGQIVLRRVFADISQRKDWASEGQYLITHCGTKNGKNHADIRLTISAMDIAQRSLATGFIIASDDSDFEPLIAHLTEQGFSALRIRKSVAVKVKPALTPQDRVRQLIADSKGGKLLMATVNGAMKGFNISETPEKDWRTWLTDNGFFCDPKGPAAYVRLAPHNVP